VCAGLRGPRRAGGGISSAGRSARQQMRALREKARAWVEAGSAAGSTPNSRTAIPLPVRPSSRGRQSCVQVTYAAYRLFSSHPYVDLCVYRVRVAEQESRTCARVRASAPAAQGRAGARHAVELSRGARHGTARRQRRRRQRLRSSPWGEPRSVLVRPSPSCTVILPRGYSATRADPGGLVDYCELSPGGRGRVMDTLQRRG
jgi:hypothetical protein